MTFVLDSLYNREKGTLEAHSQILTPGCLEGVGFAPTYGASLFLLFVSHRNPRYAATFSRANLGPAHLAQCDNPTKRALSLLRLPNLTVNTCCHCLPFWALLLTFLAFHRRAHICASICANVYASDQKLCLNGPGIDYPVGC